MRNISQVAWALLVAGLLTSCERVQPVDLDSHFVILRTDRAVFRIPAAYTRARETIRTDQIITLFVHQENFEPAGTDPASWAAPPGNRGILKVTAIPLNGQTSTSEAMENIERIYDEIEVEGYNLPGMKKFKLGPLTRSTSIKYISLKPDIPVILRCGYVIEHGFCTLQLDIAEDLRLRIFGYRDHLFRWRTLVPSIQNLFQKFRT